MKPNKRFGLGLIPKKNFWEKIDTLFGKKIKIKAYCDSRSIEQYKLYIGIFYLNYEYDYKNLSEEWLMTHSARRIKGG